MLWSYTLETLDRKDLPPLWLRNLTGRLCLLLLLKRLAKTLDYGCINDVPPFDEINPSAENIARWFHEELTNCLMSEGAVVRGVTIWEGPTNSVRYEAGERA